VRGRVLRRRRHVGGLVPRGANFAAVTAAPLILLCNNNQWAISTPLEAQTRCRPLADKAIGYGMPGVRVDGTDVLAVYEAAREAVSRARAARPDRSSRRSRTDRAACDCGRSARVHRPRPRRGGEEARVRRSLRGLPAAEPGSSTTTSPSRSGGGGGRMRAGIARPGRAPPATCRCCSSTHTSIRPAVVRIGSRRSCGGTLG
jgi:hypothetical protein